MFRWLEARSGSSAGAVRARRRLVLQRGVTALLITVLIWGQCPASLWAVGLEGLVDGDRAALAATLDGAMPVSGDESSTGADEGRGDAAPVVADGDVTGTSASQDAAAGTADAGSTAPAAAPSDVAASADAAVRDEDDLPGPVNASNQIALSRVELYRDDVKISGDIDAMLAPGDTIRASAVTGGSSADTATNGSIVDADGVSCTWTLLARKDDEQGVSLGAGSSVTLPEGEQVLGSYLKVEASAGANVVSYTMGPIARAGALRLANVSIDVEGGEAAAEGATLVAKPVLTAGKVPPAESVSYQWWISRNDAASFERIVGATDARLPIDSSMIGAYLKVTATAGGYNEVRAVAGPILPGTSGVDDPSAPAAKTVTARVVGVGERDGDGVLHQETWIPLREVVVPGDEPVSAWDIFAQLLEEAGYTYSLTGGVPYSITTPDGSRTLAMSSTAPWSYWSFLVDGEYADDYANNVTVHDGDAIELVYVDGSGAALPENDVVIDSGAERPAWGSSWPGFTTSNRPVSSPTPTQAAEEKWVAQVGAGRENLSDPILIGDYLYIASTDRLIMMDAATGATVREAKLAATIDSTARMVYADGVVIVPLHAGRLQALTADELVTTWLTQPLPAATTPSGTVVEQQSLGTLTVRDGYVYAGTSDGSYDGSGTGYLFCVNIANGAVRWSKSMAGGYYWAGAAAAGDYLVVGDDAGSVYAFDPATGETVGEPLSLGAQVRSTIVSDGTYLYAADYKGTLHKLVMGADGSLAEVARVAFGKYCTSTPALVDGKVVLCGQSATQGPSKYMKYAAVFVIDAETMTVEHEVCKTADGGFLPTMYSQASPLVSMQDGAAYVYFTVNWNPSGLYRYRIGDDAVDVVYTPADANQDYCLSSVVAGADGSLYYINDSGSLFALKGAPSWRVRFDARDGSVPATVYVKKDHVVAAPDDPVRLGYEFGGWFIDEACERAWSFDQPVSSDLTLFAKWIPAGGSIDPDDGQDAGGQQGGGDAGSGGSANEGGMPGATGVLPGVAPLRGALGSVAPGRRPLSGRVAAGAASIAGSSSGSVGEQASPAAESVSGPVLERYRRASARDGMATVMAVLGIAGVVGLLATGGWLVISVARRRR